MPHDPWTILGIEPGADSRAVRKAYLKAVKRTKPEQDPEGFQRLRAAYERLSAETARPIAQRRPHQ